MTDLNSLDALVKNQEEGRPLVLKHPVTSEPIGVTLRVLGYESDAVRKVQRRQINQRFRNQRKKPTAEEMEANGREVQVAAIVGWDWSEGTVLDGAVPEFSAEAVDRLLKRWPFASKQVDDFADDAANFL